MLYHIELEPKYVVEDETKKSGASRRKTQYQNESDSDVGLLNCTEFNKLIKH